MYDDGHREEVTDTDVAEFAIDYVDGQIIDDPFEGDLSHDGDDADIIVAEDHTALGALACAKVKLYHGQAPCGRYQIVPSTIIWIECCSCCYCWRWRGGERRDNGDKRYIGSLGR